MNPQEAKKYAALLGGLVFTGIRNTPIEMSPEFVAIFCAIPISIAAFALAKYLKFRKSPEGRKVISQQREWDFHNKLVETALNARDVALKNIKRNDEEILRLALNRGNIPDIPGETPEQRRQRLNIHYHIIDREIKKLENLNDSLTQKAHTSHREAEIGQAYFPGSKGRRFRRLQKGRNLGLND